MSKSTKEMLLEIVLPAGILLLVVGVIVSGVIYGQSRAREARGPILFGAGQEVTIKITGEHTTVVGVFARPTARRWLYRCRVAFGRKDYPIGVITNPTQIMKTYDLVDFYGFELEAR